MINRRQFCFSLAGLSTLLVVADAPPAVASAPGPAPLALEALSPAERGQIAVLEGYLQRQPDVFSRYVHNELRHLYHTISAERSFYHANVILEHATMDTYMLNILSEWNLGRDPGIAIGALWSKVQRYPQFAFLSAACLIQIGDVFLQQARLAAARRVYQAVAAGKPTADVGTSALDSYRQIALFRLTVLGPVGAQLGQPSVE